MYLDRVSPVWDAEANLACPWLGIESWKSAGDVSRAVRARSDGGVSGGLRGRVRCLAGAHNRALGCSARGKALATPARVCRPRVTVWPPNGCAGLEGNASDARPRALRAGAVGAMLASALRAPDAPPGPQGGAKTSRDRYGALA